MPGAFANNSQPAIINTNKEVSKVVKQHLASVSAIVVLALSVLALLTSGQQAYAATSTTSDDNTMKISPLRTDITVKSGKSTVVKVRVDNLTKSPVKLQAIENDFVAGNEEGAPNIILDANKYAPSHSLKRFMVPVKDFTIPAKSFTEVKLRINVPSNASPGGYFGALRFTPAAGSGDTSVNLQASAASLVLLTVPGNFTELLSLAQFDVTRNGSPHNILTGSDGVSVALRFKNSGDVQVAPFGQIYVKKGDKVIYTSNFNQDHPRGLVLPDSARRWNVPLDKLGGFGKYTVGATFAYGTTNHSINVDKTVWVIPVKIIIIAVSILIALILLIVGTILFLRSYKKRVLRGGGRGLHL